MSVFRYERGRADDWYESVWRQPNYQVVSTTGNVDLMLPQQVGRFTAYWTLDRFGFRLAESFYSKTRNTNTASPNDPTFDSVSKPAFITDASVS